MGKYFKYAIGEILLVVIGILIALSINNWNQNRITKNKETLILKELNQEFLNNREQLIEIVSWHQKGLVATEKIIDLFPIKLEDINLDSLKLYYIDTAWRYTFNPSQGVINSLVNTSSFEIVSSNELRKLIISWSDVLADYQDEEMVAFNYISNTVAPFYEEHLDWDGNFTDSRNNLGVLTTLKFESIMKQRRGDLNDILSTTGELNTIQGMIDRIIELSSQVTYD